VNATSRTPSRGIVPKPSKEEMDAFFVKINTAIKKPAILKVVEPYSEQFIPKVFSLSLPKSLAQLYDPDSLHMEYLPLLDLCEKVYESIKV